MQFRKFELINENLIFRLIQVILTPKKKAFNLNRLKALRLLKVIFYENNFTISFPLARINKAIKRRNPVI